MTVPPTFTATRYVQPLREGGTLPAVVETHGGGLFVAKFRGAGQGAKALVAELLVGMIADGAAPAGAGAGAHRAAAGLRADGAGPGDPGPAAGQRGHQRGAALPGRRLQLPARLRRRPGDAGAGGARRLAGRVHDQPGPHGAQPQPADPGPPPLAHRPRRGAVRAAQLAVRWTRRARARPFRSSRTTCCCATSGDLQAADEECAARLADGVLAEIVGRLPDALLADPAVAADFATPEAARERYLAYLRTRIQAPRAFVAEATEATDEAVAASRAPACTAADERPPPRPRAGSRTASPCCAWCRTRTWGRPCPWA